MAASKAATEAPLVACLISHVSGWTVTREGTTLKASDPRVVQNPSYFVPADMPDEERRAAAGRVFNASAYAPERELSKDERRRYVEQMEQRRLANDRKGSKSYGYTGRL